MVIIKKFCFLILICARSKAVDICQGDIIENDYDYHITSKSEDYKNLPLNCSLVLRPPPDNLVIIYRPLFEIQFDDYVHINGHCAGCKILLHHDEYGKWNAIWNTSSISFHYYSSGNHGKSSFDFQYAFITKIFLDDIHGTIRPNLLKDFTTYEIRKKSGFTRFLSLFILSDVNYDPEKVRNCKRSEDYLNPQTKVTVYVDGIMFENLECTNQLASFYDGNNITIQFDASKSKQINNTKYEIQFKSMRKRGVLSCVPHFDCEDSFCVPLEVRCDGQLDCNNGRDEMFCSSIDHQNATSQAIAATG